MYVLLSQKHLNNVIRGDSFRSEQTAHTSPSRLQSLLLQWNISTSLVYVTVPFCYYKDIFLYWTGLIKDATEYFCISKLLCSIFLYEQWIKVTERGSLHCSVYSLTLPCYMEPVQNPIWYHGGKFSSYRLEGQTPSDHTEMKRFLTSNLLSMAFRHPAISL